MDEIYFRSSNLDSASEKSVGSNAVDLVLLPLRVDDTTTYTSHLAFPKL